MGQSEVLRFIYVHSSFNRYYALIPILALILMVLGCDDNFHGINGDSASGDSSEIENDTTPPSFTSEPIFTMAPNPDTPLSGLLELATDEPTSVSVTITETTTTNTSFARGVFEPSTIEFDDRAIEHSLPILGFTPGGSFTIQIAVRDAFGNQTQFDQPILVNTDPLPEDFPPIDVTSNPEMMEPGVTLFDIGARGANISFGEALIAVNETGDVVWYHKPTGGASDARMLPNGNILFLAPQAPNEIIEMDMLGNIVSRWHSTLTSGFGPDSIAVSTNSFHHEVFAMDNGNILALSVELVVIDDYPSSDADPEAPLETAFVAGDHIVEFAPDGAIINEWSMLDLLDPFRIGYNSLGGFWNNTFYCQ